MTLSSYVTGRRIAYARYFLRKTDQSMAEIAAECGFFDRSHFTRTFGKREGMSPLRYGLRAGVETVRPLL